MSCSKDDDDTVYIDPSILNGKWAYNVTVGNGGVQTFMYGFRNGYVTYYWYSSNGVKETTLVNTTFKLTETGIIFPEKTYLGEHVKYRVVADTLFTNEKTKYIRLK